MMPAYERRRRPWDWFTLAEIKHLPAAERDTIMRIARKAAVEDRPLGSPQVANLGLVFLVFLLLALGRAYAAASFFGEYFVVVAFYSFALLVALGAGLRSRTIIRRSVREQLFARNICPAYCFDCGAFTEGYEGKECPVCGTALVPVG